MQQHQRGNFGARLSNPMIVIPGDENALHRRLPLRVLLAALPGLLLPRLAQVPAQVSLSSIFVPLAYFHISLLLPLEQLKPSRQSKKWPYLQKLRFPLFLICSHKTCLPQAAQLSINLKKKH